VSDFKAGNVNWHFGSSQADQSASQGRFSPRSLSPAQLQQLVAPIAVYRGSLVAQSLAAATYPDQVVEAGRWLERDRELKGNDFKENV
jgi:hypothetical protein